MTKTLRRSLAVAAVAGLGWWTWRAFQTQPVLCDVDSVRVQTLVATVDDDGRTRVRERFTISAPIQGQLLRTVLEPGDVVQAGTTVVADFVPIAPALLDDRARNEAFAREQRAAAALAESETRLAQQETECNFTESEVRRLRELEANQVLGAANLERAERDAQRARDGLRGAQFAVQVARFELELARASLHDAKTAGADGASDVPPAAPRRMQLRSPIDGRVLRVFEKSTRALAAGTAILEVGDLDSLEVVAELLTQHAMQVRAGMPVTITGFVHEGATPLRGVVRIVEPSGFTKISALGVEEQRVLVRIDPDGDPEAWKGLGDGYRVEVAIELWRATVTAVPAGALFQIGGDQVVYVVDSERARLRKVAIGRRTSLAAEVNEGLTAGDRVVLYPSALLYDGAPVQAR